MVGAGIVLDDLECAVVGQGHGAHLDPDLGLDRIIPGALEHAAALDARHHLLEVEEVGVQVVDGLRGGEGVVALDGDDKANIEQTIDDDVLKRQRIAYRSSSMRRLANGRLAAEGELTLLGETRPLTVELAVDGDGALTGTALIKQSEWGIKPYSTLFGALKVADE